MHHCGSSRGSAYTHGAGGVVPCSCNDYQRMGSCCGGGTSALTILFDMPNKMNTEEETFTDPYTYYSSSSSSCSSPVDCTLSLGTASTRQRSTPKSPQRTTAANNSSSCMPTTFYWDILSQASKTPAASSKCGGSVGVNSDPLVARRCANCDTTSTPLWRNGPRGPKSLCNACGIRYKKEERRAAATAACPAAVEPQRHVMAYTTYQQDHPWAYAPSPQGSARKSQSISRWSDETEGGDDGAALPYLSWCLNVPHHPPHRAEFLRH